MKKISVIMLCVLALAAEAFGEDIGGGNLDLNTVLVNSDNPQVIYIGSRRGIFKSEDAGKSWENIFSARGLNKGVIFLSFAPNNKNSLYALTNNGLYLIHNDGKNWEKILREKSCIESEYTSIALAPSAVYLGTKGGLFRSEDGLKSWKRVFGHSSDKDSEESAEEKESSEIICISVDPNNLDHLYLATNRSIYKSSDKGGSWELFSGYGLSNRKIKFLLVSAKSCLYALTNAGVFEYKDSRWQELSLGLMTQDIESLALDNQDNFYLAGKGGLFKANKKDIINYGQGNPIDLYHKNEPDIRSIHNAAIKYAEVEPEKILRWRKQARMKAILPRLTLGLDRDESTDHEIYTSATTKYVYEGPLNKSNGWDVTLSWELGDLIWNESQASIDVRSKLMVELRDDILDEINKVYFERLRIKAELDNLSIEDKRKRFEKELKIEELTASLDALTGGYFSSQIRPSS